MTVILNFKTYFWLFLLILTALRLHVAGQFGLTVDEAHYVLYGRIPALSYFDHPPLVGWVQALFQQFPLSHLLQARLGAILISLLTSGLLLSLFKRKQVPAKSAYLAIMVLNLTPMFNAMSVALLPDTLLMPLTLLIVLATENVLERPDARNWALLGFWLGLAGLSKYTAAVYIVGLVLIFISKKKIREVFNPGLWLGVAVAMLIVSPVLYWNVKNQWISLKYQGEHVFAFDSSLLRNLAGSFVMQFISWGGGPFLVSIAVFFAMIRQIKHQKSYFVLLVFLSVFLLFFVYIGLSTPLLPHWMLIFFVLSIPLSTVYLLQNKMLLRTLAVAVSVSAAISSALLLELGFKIFPIANTAALYEGIAGWDSVMDTANEKLKLISNPRKALAVMNWTLGSRAMYYNRATSAVFVIDARFDQFDIWAPQLNSGYDLIAIIEADKRDEHLAHLICAQLTAVGEQKTLIKDVPVNHFLYYHCADFSGYR